MNSNLHNNMKYVLLVFILAILLALILPLFDLESYASSSYEIRITSNYPFSINGTPHNPGTYYLNNLSTITNITFLRLLYQGNFSRAQLQGIYINGKFINCTSSTNFYQLNYSNTSVVIIISTKGISSITIQSSYIKQYYVKVNSQYPLPIVSGWYDSGYHKSVSSNYIYYNGSTRYVLTGMYINGTKSYSLTVNSPLIINTTFITEYFINFTKPIYGYNNGTFEFLRSEWLENGTILLVPQYINITNTTRLFTFGNLTGLILIDKPLIINDSQITQYYVKSENIIQGYINDKFSNITSNWYNSSTRFFIPLTIPLQNYYRIETYGNIIGEFTLIHPIIINDVQDLQYYLQFPFPLNLQISNGSKVSVESIWINNGNIVSVPNQIVYITSKERAIVSQQNFSSPNLGKLNYTLQFLVYANLPTPINVNGENMTITSEWFNQSSKIILYNIYYINNFERIVILSSNIQNVTVHGPIYIDVYYIYQYLVSIKGYYENTSSIILNENLWEPYESNISIPATYSYEGAYFKLIQGNDIYYVTSPLDISVHYAPQNITITTSANSQDYGKSLLVVFTIIVILILISSLLLIIVRKKL